MLSLLAWTLLSLFFVVAVVLGLHALARLCSDAETVAAFCLGKRRERLTCLYMLSCESECAKKKKNMHCFGEGDR